jgi:1-acyl-sn-glycerol-3-phosphate acyltransferase
VQYQLSRLIAGPFLRGLARPRVTGAEHIPASGGAILASNHLSVVDSVYLPLMLDRPVTFAAKSEYFTSNRPGLRLMGLYLKATGQLSVDRAGARAAQEMLDAALALLTSGELFGIYPEGTRSPDGRLYRGRPGVGWLALKSGLPVIPVAMIGTDRVLPPGRMVPRPGKIEIRIGKPMTFGTGPGAGREAPGKARRAIADEVVRAIQELSGQEYAPMYASVRKEQLAAEAGNPARPGPAGTA